MFWLSKIVYSHFYRNRFRKGETTKFIMAKVSKEKRIENINTPEAHKKSAETKRANALMRNVVYEELKTKLLKEDGKGKAYYQKFLDKFLDTALKYPDSKPGATVAETIFQKELLQMLDEQHEKEMNKDRDFLRYRLIKEFFKEQREVILETNHSKRIIACCSRRAGKTDLASGSIVYASIIPDSRIIYINLTFTNAINQIWNNTLKRAEAAGLGISKSSKADGTIEFSNGSSLRIMGNPNNAEIEKLRGESKVSLIIVDEFFHQRNMQYAIDEVISPLMADRKDSTLLCIGTPPRLAKTYGEKCWSESGWKRFHWTMFDNPYMPEPMNYLEDYCKNKGITMDSPFIQREYFGKIGVYDTEALVFKGRQTYNKFDENEPITNVAIGVDYGHTDFTAVISVAYNKTEKKSWITKETKFNRAGVSDIIEAVIEHYNEAKKLCNLNHISKDCIYIYADTDRQEITQDLITKYNLPAFNCYKYDKMYAVGLLAEELRTGRMKIPNNGILDEEMEQILYQRSDDDDSILPAFDEEIGIHPDAAMALLYASRKVFFDMDYDIAFKESEPKMSDYVKTPSGTIIEVAPLSKGGDYEDMGVIG